MKVELTVTVEVSDETATLVNKSTMGGIGGMVVNIVRTALTDGTFKRVTVDVVEGYQNDGEEIVSAPAVSVPNRPRTAVSVPRKASSAPVESGRTGRPKTLHGYEASDGLPVREWGTRSPEALAEAGIDVWQVDSEAADTAPAPRPAPKSQSPAAHVQQNSGKRAAAAPVTHKVKSRK